MNHQTLQQPEKGNRKNKGTKSDVHMQSCEAELAAIRTMKEGSIIQQLQHVGEQEKLKNRMAIKALFRCIHYLHETILPTQLSLTN